MLVVVILFLATCAVHWKGKLKVALLSFATMISQGCEVLSFCLTGMRTIWLPFAGSLYEVEDDVANISVKSRDVTFVNL